MKRGRVVGEKGSVLTFVLLTIVVVGGGVAGLLSLERARQNRVLQQARAKRTLQLAEATVDQAAVLVSYGTLGENGAINWGNDGLDNDGDGAVDEPDEQVTATLFSWHTDGADNDGDGQTDEKDEMVIRVTSDATIGGVARRVTGWLQRSAATLPDPQASVYLDDPNADVTFQGNAFVVNGNDGNLNGTPGSAAPLYGIAINGDPQSVVTQLSAQQLDNVLGYGPSPSVTGYAPPDPDLIDNVIAALTPRASIVFNSYGGVYTGTLGDYAAGNFQITKSNGDLKIGGGSTGAGILLVEGNLEISGAWDYVGYIFVTGRVDMKGGAGTKRLRGTMFVEGDVVQGSTVMLWVNGTVDLLYSSQALTLVREAFGTYGVSAVTEP
ncbi:MAG TPA: hypothetical protein VFI25_11125 [Planctomycetota bacterium]|jgi:hypothetical protein|nr:hypothetical protein [Planctomycetota bacterium]